MSQTVDEHVSNDERTGLMALPELTKTRVESTLKSMDLNFGTDNDGDIACFFDTVRFFITIDDLLLRISGWWAGKLTEEEHFSKAIAWANQTNSTAVFPKAVVEGSTETVIFENSIFTDGGVSDEQLESFLGVSISASCRLADELAEALPECAPTIEENE